MSDPAEQSINPTMNATPQGDADDKAAARRFALSVPEDDLYEECKKYIGWRHYPYPAERPIIWVKYGGPARQAEAEMHLLAWNFLRKEHQAKRYSTIHIPEIFKVFHRGEGTFIIMELLEATLLRDYAQSSLDQCYDLIAQGIQVLCGMPVPEDATPGPYAKDRDLRQMTHPIFRDHVAPTVYKTVGELEGHLARAIARARWRKGAPRPTIHLEEQLAFCYCDLNDENFLFKTDTTGQLHLYMIDFEHASFLPLSFLSYALLVEAKARWFTGEPLIQRIGHTLPTGNLKAMEVAAYNFHVSSNWFGLVVRQQPTHENVSHQGTATGQDAHEQR